jgi:hypothetical protein
MSIELSRAGWCVLLVGSPWLAALPVAAQSMKLNGPLFQVRDRDVASYRISADGARIVFRVDLEADGRFELFSVPADASAPPVRLNDGSCLPAERGRFRDRRRAAWRTSPMTGQQAAELFSVELEGGVPIRLNGELVPGGAVGGIAHRPGRRDRPLHGRGSDEHPSFPCPDRRQRTGDAAGSRPRDRWSLDQPRWKPGGVHRMERLHHPEPVQRPER